MELPFQTALILAAHTDDEFGCSGTMARMIEAGITVYCATFSRCEESVPQGFPLDVLEKEWQKATACLGVPPTNLRLYPFRVRHFPQYRQDILEELVLLRQEIQPDLVFIPSLTDIHQDHKTMAEEGLRAFKHSTVLGYELPMNTISFHHACFVQLEERHLNAKINSIMCYESQSFRNYRNEEFLRGLARVRGVQINANYAEAFEVLRWVIR
ncbi:MAG: PIG-L family deacetylase [Anaerolineales bacterium]|nr:PIG-L family deacetylase [Anaerolineales bacterium]